MSYHLSQVLDRTMWQWNIFLIGLLAFSRFRLCLSLLYININKVFIIFGHKLGIGIYQAFGISYILSYSASHYTWLWRRINRCQNTIIQLRTHLPDLWQRRVLCLFPSELSNSPVVVTNYWRLISSDLRLNTGIILLIEDTVKIFWKYFKMQFKYMMIHVYHTILKKLIYS